jgi:hypothetical protein
VDPRIGLEYVEKILDPTGTRTSASRSSSPYLVAIPTALSRLTRTCRTILKLERILKIPYFLIVGRLNNLLRHTHHFYYP